MATPADYDIAYGLRGTVLRRTFTPPNQRALDLVAALPCDVRNGTNFTRAQCQAWAGLGAIGVGNRLRVLVDVGLVEQIQGGGKGVLRV